MKKLTAIILLLAAASSHAQRVDYSVVFVPEESGNNITRISTAGDYVCLLLVSRNAAGIKWYTNRILGVSPNGTQLAYISNRNNATNIFLTDLRRQGGSVQRTNRQGVQDFSFSPDGKYMVHPRIALASLYSSIEKAANSLSLWFPNHIRYERQLIISGIRCSGLLLCQYRVQR